MTRHVALLRGINVGGKKKVAMADLRALVAGVGHTDVATYINSGNVVFTSGTPDAGRDELEAAIERAIEAELGLEVAVLVRTHDELAAAVDANPFPDAVPARLLLTFLRDEPAAGAYAAAERVRSGADEFRVVGTTLYLHCPDGIGRSKLAEALGRVKGPVGTARNLGTVRKLIDLSRDEPPEGS
ncbi:DUF1697 domain-containing protein [Jiangella rhizosphaerae]|uniref:DUF1697 domain-containing protein n=1 Tax=Jiangella rhizosphaerae TaxID=2293569 RepID=A0A418KX67_9ACTN|nr:DUF1697 domain-containing protein [Jiangella rhizosphaerae]RIQ36713.1 DUF1697 domain-containing protein [Jiangella rhizosphaerae]